MRYDTLGFSILPNELLKFLSGEGPDHYGRTIDQIVAWNDAQLESCHDYIQWVFPNRMRSRFNPESPILDDDTVDQIVSSPQAIENIRRVFFRMIGFYGLTVRHFNDGTFQLDLSEMAKRPVWISPGNHNFLRLTRILLALQQFALDDEFEALADVLDLLGRRYHNIIGDRTIQYWRDVVDQQCASSCR